MSKTKVVMINERPVTYEKAKDYVALTFYGHRGTVSLDYWGYEKKKKESIKELSELRDMLDKMIEDVKNMEEKR